MGDIIIFMVGCVVSGVTFAAVFIYMIATDNPNKSD